MFLLLHCSKFIDNKNRSAARIPGVVYILPNYLFCIDDEPNERLFGILYYFKTFSYQKKGNAKCPIAKINWKEQANIFMVLNIALPKTTFSENIIFPCALFMHCITPCIKSICEISKNKKSSMTFNDEVRSLNLLEWILICCKNELSIIFHSHFTNICMNERLSNLNPNSFPFLVLLH